MAALQFEVPTWSQIYDLLLDQAQKILASGFKPDVVVGVARGGTVPARVLVDLLETAQLVFCQIEFYSGIAQTQKEPVLKQALAMPVAGKKILLVDDISDTGKSLHLAKRILQEQGAYEVKTATLYYKPTSLTQPDFYEKQTLNWIVFPWECKETLRKIIQTQTGKRALNQEIAKLVKAGLPKQLTEKLLADMT